MKLDDQFSDIQGLIMRGYGYMKAACYLILTIEDPMATKNWLKGLAPRVTHSGTKPADRCINLAFTKWGLEKIGLPKPAIAGFSREFRDGMNAEHRQRMLGDIMENAPKNWSWGTPEQTKNLHLLLMAYAPNDQKLSTIVTEIRNNYQKNGLSEIIALDTSSEVLAAGKEHFGFRDGLSQPVINKINRKTGQEEPDFNQIEPGEVLLGYENHFGKYPYSPGVARELDKGNILPVKEGSITEEKDFGKNGSYLVFRQLEQKVKAFWEYMDENALGNQGKTYGRELLAAKMVGRWRGGAPLAVCPYENKPELQEENYFLYQKEDTHGYKCPVGSHIRRTNPRDVFQTSHKEPIGKEKKTKKEAKKSIAFVKKHRIVRRGRPYGPPVAASLEPEDILKAPADNLSRGLHFVCFNANIARQFELIQQTWVHKKFEGLYNDPDPIILGPADKGLDFTIQAEPIRKKVHNLPQFVHMKGGAYFFMPSIKALKFLSDL